MVSYHYNASEDDYNPWNGQVINHEIFKQRVMYSRNAFPDLNLDIQEKAEGNDSKAIRWIMSGTHDGDLPSH